LKRETRVFGNPSCLLVLVLQRYTLANLGGDHTDFFIVLQHGELSAYWVAKIPEFEQDFFIVRVFLVGGVAVLMHTCKRELSPAHLVCPRRHNV
jgi:hypothetical protein